MDIFVFYQKEYNYAREGSAEMEKFAPKKADKEVTTIRIPKDILDIIDMKSAAYGISRNEFINQCILYAIKNMEDQN